MNACKVKPAVSVVVPFRNAEETMGACLSSIEGQTWIGTTAVLIDDGSSDGGADIACEFADRNDWTLLRTNGGGAWNARNCGIDECTTDQVVFLDADDTLYPWAVESLVSTAASFGSQIVFGRHYFVNWMGMAEPVAYLRWLRECSSEQNLREDSHTALGNPVVTGKLFETRFIRESGLRFEPLSFGEDTLFSLRAWIAAKDVRCAPRAVYLRRPIGRRTQSMTSQLGTMKAVEDRLRVVETVHEIASKMGDTVIERTNLRTGIDQILSSVGGIGASDARAVARNLVVTTMKRILDDPRDFVTFSGITLDHLEKIPASALDELRVRYWLFSNRIKHGGVVGPRP